MDSEVILIAEDDLEDQFIMTDAFQETGIDQYIHFVENGEMVIEYLDQKKEESSPCLIVLDLNMPVMNGTVTLRRLKVSGRFSEIPVIVYSTSLNLIEMKECMQLGARSYIKKPNTFTECKEVAKQLYDFCNKRYSFPTIAEMMQQVK